MTKEELSKDVREIFQKLGVVEDIENKAQMVANVIEGQAITAKRTAICNFIENMIKRDEDYIHMETEFMNENMPFIINCWRYFSVTNGHLLIKDVARIARNICMNIAIPENFVNGIEIKTKSDAFHFNKEVLSESTLKIIENLAIEGPKDHTWLFGTRWDIKPKYRTPSGIPVYNEFHIEVDYEKQKIIDIRYPYEKAWVEANKDRFADYESDLIFLDAIVPKNIYEFEVLLKECEEVICPYLLKYDKKGTIVYKFIKTGNNWVFMDYATNLREAEKKFLNATRKETSIS